MLSLQAGAARLKPNWVPNTRVPLLAEATLALAALLLRSHHLFSQTRDQQSRQEASDPDDLHPVVRC